MFQILWLTLCAIAAIAGPLTKNQAFESVFGTSDEEELKRMTCNFQQYWETRKAQIFAPGRLKSYNDFLRLFLQQTKQRCQELIEKCGSQKEWFCDLAFFEKHLTDAKSNSADPLLFAAYYYASLCDKLLYLTTNRAKGFDDILFQSESFFKEHLFDRFSNESRGFRRDYMLWDLTNNGHFSMLDYLIVLGESGFHLGSTCEDVNARDDFFSHVRLYRAHRGTLQHDIEHVEEFGSRFQTFQQYGLQVGAYTKECFADTNPQNTLELGQKILTTFVTLHELAPVLPISMERTLLAEMTYFPDRGLIDLLPVFMEASADIAERSSQGQETSPEEGMLRELHSWREKYLGEINRRYISKAHDAVLHKTL